MATLQISPSPALVDEKILVVVGNLIPRQNYTVVSFTEYDAKRFGAFAYYKADEIGVINLAVHKSSGGSFSGVNQMGLFTHMEQTPCQKPGRRLLVRDDIEKPIFTDILVFEGHLKKNCLWQDSIVSAKLTPIASSIVSRTYFAENIVKFDVKVGSIRGALFLPKGKGPWPGVIDMFGTVGGLVQFRSALLARHGFAALALSYFKYDDLGDSFDVNLEYFEEAVDYLLAHPQVRPVGVGVIGVSRGAEIACSMASHFPDKVNAAVCINGSFFYWRCFYRNKPLHVKETVDTLAIGRSLHGIKDPDEAVCFVTDEIRSVIMEKQPEKGSIKIEDSKGQFLFIVGESDHCTPSKECAFLIEKKFKKFNMTNYKVLSYPGGGHLIEPPYMPGCFVAFHASFGFLMDFGGRTADEHAFAQEDSWLKMIQFLHQNLQSSTSRL